MDRQFFLRALRSADRGRNSIPTSSTFTTPRLSLVCVVQQRRRRVNELITSTQYQKRHNHSKRHVSTAVSLPHHIDALPSQENMTSSTPMSCLPLATLIRSYIITSVSSFPVLLRPSLSILAFLAHSKSSLLNPDVNPLLKMLLKKTFYAQFCAGETSPEVQTTINSLKAMGYKGVILGHAKEVVMSKEEQSQLDEAIDAETELNAKEIGAWKENTLRTIQLTQPGDFVALKFTGAGRQALQHLKETRPCAPIFEQAVDEMCKLAESRGVGLLFDAEQAAIQQAIDNWTLYFMKRYNKGAKAVVFGTYQAYAKRAPLILAQHLAEAQKHNFTLGVKLVRGAYINSDPRHLFWDTIEETHRCYDSLAKCIMERQYSGHLQPASSESTAFPRVSLVLASHNARSVASARQLRDQQAQIGQERIPMAYGQLMGMADNVSCDIVQAARERQSHGHRSVEVPQAYKYLVWGTMGECMKYLLRRAQENKDAVSRTIDARQALGRELARRMGISG